MDKEREIIQQGYELYREKVKEIETMNNSRLLSLFGNLKVLEYRAAFNKSTSDLFYEIQLLNHSVTEELNKRMK